MALDIVYDLSGASIFARQDADDAEKGIVASKDIITLVDSVVNNGKPMVESVPHLRQMCPNAHIVMMAIVIYSKGVGD
jgi:orotate phosphoribosyltransferase-like protein